MTVAVKRPPATPTVGGPAPGRGADGPDPQEPYAHLLRDLRTSEQGLTSREAARRLEVSGPNELPMRSGDPWWHALVAQLVHPLALLLWVAAALAFATGTPVVAIAVVGVIVLNASFAFAQERHAQHAVEALAAYLPQHARVLRDRVEREILARDLVPGDVVVINEGDRISADARLVSGSVEVDMSTVNGESVPVTRTAAAQARATTPLEAADLVFSGTTCTAGAAHAVVHATGARTEIGRIATLSGAIRNDPSPLELQVKRAAWLIAAVAVAVGVAFLPLGLLAGLSLDAAALFSIGLLVANVPEGLLPTITLALAVGVRELAGQGALVKRLSAVETLGSTNVICTDKTGTLTENRMRPVAVWVPGARVDLDGGTSPPPLLSLAAAIAACTTATLPHGDEPASGDPTELALLRAAQLLGGDPDPGARSSARVQLFAFDPVRATMSTISRRDGHLVIDVKGAPETLRPRCGRATDIDGRTRDIDPALDREITDVLETFASDGLRVLAIASRIAADGAADSAGLDRDSAEQDLDLLGLVAMRDPLRSEVPAAVATCHAAGLRVHVITGDHPVTAASIARSAGIGADGLQIITGADLHLMPEEQLDALLHGGDEIVFARSSPEDKLRIADAIKAGGDVVAMTGDGVNDAPALRRADLGIAMGRSGTDVAREAATMVLTDDNFATIVRAIEAGRRAYDNVRKFVTYIFAHAMPELIPFLAFALSGGLVPLPMNVLQILAIDLGTDTLPALALSREPAEPGVMQRPPRPRRESVIDRAVLIRAWGVLGLTEATLVLGAFFFTLLHGGWTPGAATGGGAALHHVYRQATTATFAGIVACQLGAGFAAKTQRASLHRVGALGNPLLLKAMAVEVVFAGTVMYASPFQHVFGTAALPPSTLALIAAFPFVVWGIDELYRARLRRRDPGPRSPHDRPLGSDPASQTGTKVERTTRGALDDDEPARAHPRGRSTTRR